MPCTADHVPLGDDPLDPRSEPGDPLAKAGGDRLDVLASVTRARRRIVVDVVLAHQLVHHFQVPSAEDVRVEPPDQLLAQRNVLAHRPTPAGAISLSSASNDRGGRPVNRFTVSATCDAYPLVPERR